MKKLVLILILAMSGTVHADIYEDLYLGYQVLTDEQFWEEIDETINDPSYPTEGLPLDIKWIGNMCGVEVEDIQEVVCGEDQMHDLWGQCMDDCMNDWDFHTEDECRDQCNHSVGDWGDEEPSL